MLQMSRVNGKALLIGVMAVGLMGSCMQDHGGGGDYIAHPYMEGGYYSDGKLFYDMDQKTASVVGTDGGASEVILPDAIEINGETYPLVRIKNLGIFTSPDDYGKFGVTANGGLSSLQLSSTLTSIQSVVQQDVLFESVVYDPKEEDVYQPQLAWGAPLKRRYPIKTLVVRAGNQTYDSREGSNCLIQYATGRVVFAGLDAKVPPAIKEIVPCAFIGCERLDKDCTLPSGLVNIGYSAFQNCALTKVVLPSSLEVIGSGAFFGNHLREMTIPAAVTEIGDGAFSGNDLTAIVVDPANETYDSRNNCHAIIETESGKLLQGCENTVIPNEVTAIAPCAFYQCNRLKNIDLPDSLVSIGDHAFMDCITLEAAIIPNATTSIGKSAFYGCKKLSQVVLPKGVKVGEGAFRNCDGLADQQSFVKVLFDDPSAVDPAVFSFSKQGKKAMMLLVPNEAETRFLESEWNNYFLSISTY